MFPKDIFFGISKSTFEIAQRMCCLYIERYYFFTKLMFYLLMRIIKMLYQILYIFSWSLLPKVAPGGANQWVGSHWKHVGQFVSVFKWVECSLIMRTGCSVQVFVWSWAAQSVYGRPCLPGFESCSCQRNSSNVISIRNDSHVLVLIFSNTRYVCWLINTKICH